MNVAVGFIEKFQWSSSGKSGLMYFIEAFTSLLLETLPKSKREGKKKIGCEDDAQDL
jgi:hypothetical protein